MQFSLNKKELTALLAFKEECRVAGVKKQRVEMKNPDWTVVDCWDAGYPYTGAVGGNLTFSFTPTSIGTVVKVRDSVTGAEIDVTDYDMF